MLILPRFRAMLFADYAIIMLLRYAMPCLLSYTCHACLASSAILYTLLIAQMLFADYYVIFRRFITRHFDYDIRVISLSLISFLSLFSPSLRCFLRFTALFR